MDPETIKNVCIKACEAYRMFLHFSDFPDAKTSLAGIDILRRFYDRFGGFIDYQDPSGILYGQDDVRNTGCDLDIADLLNTNYLFVSAPLKESSAILDSILHTVMSEGEHVMIVVPDDRSLHHVLDSIPLSFRDRTYALNFIEHSPLLQRKERLDSLRREFVSQVIDDSIGRVDTQLDLMYMEEVRMMLKDKGIIVTRPCDLYEYVSPVHSDEYIHHVPDRIIVFSAERVSIAHSLPLFTFPSQMMLIDTMDGRPECHMTRDHVSKGVSDELNTRFCHLFLQDSKYAERMLYDTEDSMIRSYLECDDPEFWKFSEYSTL